MSIFLDYSGSYSSQVDHFYKKKKNNNTNNKK